MPGHHPADRADIGLGCDDLVRELAVEHDDDPVRELQNLVEILARRYRPAGGFGLGGASLS